MAQIVPLRHALANGDVVEVLTQKGHAPSRDWLAFVHTSRARSKIRQWIQSARAQEATGVGRRLLEKEARSLGISLKKIPDEQIGSGSPPNTAVRAPEDLYADLGYGKWSARQVIAKATGQPLAEPAETKSTENRRRPSSACLELTTLRSWSAATAI